MKNIIFILLTCLSVNAQDGWEKIKQRDDILHVDGSILLTLASGEITYNLTKNVTKTMIIAPAVSLFCGIVIKEYVHDKWMKRGVFSTMDIFYDAWGTIIGVIIERCWLHWRGKETIIDPYDYSTVKKKKRYSLKINSLLL